LSAFTNSPGYLSSVDMTLSVNGVAADAKAVGDALRNGYTDWIVTPSVDPDLSLKLVLVHLPYSEDLWFACT